jgi:hypothetical protein
MERMALDGLVEGTLLKDRDYEKLGYYHERICSSRGALLEV